MAGEWVEKSLGDLVDIKHGFAFEGKYFRDEPPGDVLLTPGNFAVGGGFKADKFRYYDGPVPEEFVLHSGDLLITMTDLSKDADTLGYPAIVPVTTGHRRYLHNQRLGKVLAKERVPVNLRYVHYLLCSQRYRDEIVASATGTTVKHTSPERIKRFRFLLPPSKDQSAIAHILGTLDHKIELNRRMNETLEAIARAIFKSWFIDFDPVRAKVEGRDPGLPKHIADLFPDRFQESELGEIPGGWEVGPILKQAKLLSGGTPKTDHDDYWDGDILWASAKDVSQCSQTFLIEPERTITKKGLEESATQLIPSFCTVVVARGATTGRMVLFGREMAMNQTCYALASATDTPFAFYCRLRFEMDDLVHAAHGSVFDTITTSTFANSKVLLAPVSLLEAFEVRVEPIFTEY